MRRVLTLAAVLALYASGAYAISKDPTLGPLTKGDSK